MCWMETSCLQLIVSRMLHLYCPDGCIFSDHSGLMSDAENKDLVLVASSLLYVPGKFYCTPLTWEILNKIFFKSTVLNYWKFNVWKNWSTVSLMLLWVYTNKNHILFFSFSKLPVLGRYAIWKANHFMLSTLFWQSIGLEPQREKAKDHKCDIVP